MKVLRDKQKLGMIGQSQIIIDWDYLIGERGLRKEMDDLQKVIGNSLKMFSMFGVSALSFWDISLGNILFIEAIKVDRFIDIIFWVIVFVYVYSTYLLRDRTKFFDTLEIKKLDYIRNLELEKKLPSEIELTDYFDYDILNIFDDLVRVSDREFLTDLIKRLIELPKVQQLVVRLGLTDEDMKKIMEKTYLEMNTGRDTWIARIIFDSFVLSYKNYFESIDEQVVFLTICLVPLKQILLEYKVMPNEIQGLLLWARNEAKKRKYLRLWKERASLKPKNVVNRSYTSRYAATLEKFKRDFTLEVISGNFTMSIAREDTLEDVIRLLHQGDKGAVIIVGEPGVGKTTLIKSLAAKMVVEDVPDKLKDMRLIGFDFTKAYAVSPSIDMFRKKVESVFREVSEALNIVLVLDDFDQLVTIREEVASEIINLMIESISKFNLRILATTTSQGYLESIKPNKGLSNLFDQVNMNEPSDEVSMQILIDMIPIFESKYKLKVSFDAIRKAVTISHKYAFDRVLPEKALDLLEESAVFANQKGLKFIAETDIEELVSKKVGVNVGAISDEEKGKLSNIEQEMHKRVVGQDAAITAIGSALRRARAGLAGDKRPISSFLFFGPTGVGKTEVAKTLAETYYGDEKLMIRIDMSEYQEDENLRRLIGYRQGKEFFGGNLTEAVREKPFSLILLDELEKANPRVLDLFLQILDEGNLTDGIGRKVNFTNTIIIATSNAGSKKISELLEQGHNYETVYKTVLPELRSIFRVEFLNRFDGVIMFKPLEKDEIQEISGLMLESVSKKLYDQGIIVDFSVNLLQELAEIGHNPVYGARELRRVIQENVEDQIARLIVDGKLTAGKKLHMKSLKEFVVE